MKEHKEDLVKHEEFAGGRARYELLMEELEYLDEMHDEYYYNYQTTLDIIFILEFLNVEYISFLPTILSILLIRNFQMKGDFFKS